GRCVRWFRRGRDPRAWRVRRLRPLGGPGAPTAWSVPPRVRGPDAAGEPGPIAAATPVIAARVRLISLTLSVGGGSAPDTVCLAARPSCHGRPVPSPVWPSSPRYR